jgi:hypothetical protein
VSAPIPFPTSDFPTTPTTLVNSPAPSLSLSSSPISDSLKAHLDDVLSQIPSGKSVLVSGGLTTTGAVASVAVKKTVGKFDVMGEGYAGKAWGGSGWEAGARGSIAF